MRTVSHEGCNCWSVCVNAGSGFDGLGGVDRRGAVDVGRVIMLVGMLVAIGVKLTSVAILVSLE